MICRRTAIFFVLFLQGYIWTSWFYPISPFASDVASVGAKTSPSLPVFLILLSTIVITHTIIVTLKFRRLGSRPRRPTDASAGTAGSSLSDASMVIESEEVVVTAFDVNEEAGDGCIPLEPVSSEIAS